MCRQMCSKIMSTTHSFPLFFVRLGLGIMILPHGLQKTFGWFGGYGFEGTLHAFTQDMHIPWIFAVLAILAEFLGGLGLIFGCLTRIAALGVGANMLVAATMIHWKNGWFMNWFGHQQGEGIEFFILAVAMAVALVIGGGGALSLDRLTQCRQGQASLPTA